MKVKVKGLVFVGFAAMIFAANAMAEPAAAGNQNTVTSKAYTEATYQHKSSGASIGNTGGTWTAVDTEVADGRTSVPTTAAVKTYVDNQVQTAGGNYQTKSTAADENKVANGNGGWKALGTTLDTTAQGYDANNAVTAGTIAAALAENAANTTYTAGTNVQISADNEISATDTTYTAGSNITIDANNNNAIAATTGAVADGATTLVTGGAVYDAIATQHTTDNTTYQAYSNAANRVSDVNGGWKALGTTLDTTAQGYDANNAVTAGTIAAALAENAANTTYTAGTNVQISADNEISATDTTYTAGSNITIDANNNNAIAATTGAVADGATTLVTGDAVYEYVQSQTGGTVIPQMDTTKCTASIPCALVAEANGEVHWRVMAVSEGQTPAAGTLADATTGA